MPKSIFDALLEEAIASNSAPAQATVETPKAEEAKPANVTADGKALEKEADPVADVAKADDKVDTTVVAAVDSKPSAEETAVPSQSQIDNSNVNEAAEGATEEAPKAEAGAEPAKSEDPTTPTEKVADEAEVDPLAALEKADSKDPVTGTIAVASDQKREEEVVPPSAEEIKQSEGESVTESAEEGASEEAKDTEDKGKVADEAEVDPLAALEKADSKDPVTGTIAVASDQKREEEVVPPSKEEIDQSENAMTEGLDGILNFLKEEDEKKEEVKPAEDTQAAGEVKDPAPEGMKAEPDNLEKSVDPLAALEKADDKIDTEVAAATDVKTGEEAVVTPSKEEIKQSEGEAVNESAVKEDALEAETPLAAEAKDKGNDDGAVPAAPAAEADPLKGLEKAGDAAKPAEGEAPVAQAEVKPESIADKSAEVAADGNVENGTDLAGGDDTTAVSKQEADQAELKKIVIIDKNGNAPALQEEAAESAKENPEEVKPETVASAAESEVKDDEVASGEDIAGGDDVTAASKDQIDQSYGSLKEAADIGIDYFKDWRHRDELRDSFIMLIAANNDDLIYKEYVAKTAEIKGLKDALNDKYGHDAGEKCDAFISTLKVPAIEKPQPALFDKLDQQAAINKAKDKAECEKCEVAEDYANFFKPAKSLVADLGDMDEAAIAEEAAGLKVIVEGTTMRTKFLKFGVNFMSEPKLRETVGRIYADAKAILTQNKDEIGLKNLEKYNPQGLDVKALRNLYKQLLDDIDPKNIAALEAKAKKAVEDSKLDDGKVKAVKESADQPDVIDPQKAAGGVAVSAMLTSGTVVVNGAKALAAKAESGKAAPAAAPVIPAEDPKKADDKAAKLIK